MISQLLIFCWHRCTLISFCIVLLFQPFRYRDHIGWNTSKIISPPNSDKIVTWRFLRNRRFLLLRLGLYIQFSGDLIYWAHHAVIFAIAWLLVFFVDTGVYVIYLCIVLLFQSIALMSSVVSGPSSAAGSHSQRTTPDVLRPAAAGTDASTTTPHGAVGGGAAQGRGPWRQRRHHGHAGGAHKRRSRSPGYHRPCSASAAQRLTVPQRKTPRHSSKSDFEVCFLLSIHHHDLDFDLDSTRIQVDALGHIVSASLLTFKQQKCTYCIMAGLRK